MFVGFVLVRKPLELLTVSASASGEMLMSIECPLLHKWRPFGSLSEVSKGAEASKDVLPEAWAPEDFAGGSS